MNEWNLGLIYKNHEDFLKELGEFPKEIELAEGLKGKLNSLEGMLEYERVMKIIDERIERLFCYASMKHDLNQKDTKASEDYQRVYQLFNELLSKTAFINPELLSNDKAKLFEYLKNERLKKYHYKLDQLFRSQDFYLDAKSEELMANYGEATGDFNRLYDKLAVSDREGVEVALSTGEVLSINESNFQYYLGILSNQEDRRIVFEAIYTFYEHHKNTFAGIYDGIMQSELADVKNRGYASILESHLYYNAIPKEVFLSLIDTARAHSAPLKEYYALRKKYLKLDTLHTYDRFLSFAESNEIYTYDAAKSMVLDACKALGEDYYQHACKALEDGRVSVYTKDGKRTGAYSTGLYKEGTFILLNHNDNLDSAFTVAHEAGHSIHSLYANENQDEVNANYTIFVAEIASTFNEQLFLDYVMKHSHSKEEKIVVLQQAIDNIVSTFYRQTLFANYEYLAHKMVEERKPVTAEALSGIMTELYKDYYGIDLNNEPLKNNVWAYIPHFFHTPFYVYQYATSFAASLAIYENVKKNPKSLDKYLAMLSMGGSNYPVEIVKTAGVDLTKTDAFLAVVNRLEELTKELKKLLEE
ncbi:MAG: oligoendopeptidase F [Roseburia sp.]|nr:oligoendopeptidase F [Anaeroplasma bactoclasticum]MCM1196759.1 oligoendopeptidase F [Roseburia sp.]MCM1556693.1 oligoendopeptidase F [Anaeroplasma bactoclasticum]